MGIKVAKFGGTSLADASAFKQVREIINADKQRKYVIASAPGKRFPTDTKVTDMLYECYDLAKSGKSTDAAFDVIKNRFANIISGLGIDFDIDAEMEIIKKEALASLKTDYFASRGEFLNAKIMAKYLGFPFIDAKDVVFFKEDGHLDEEKTYAVFAQVVGAHEYAVIPGFYGSDVDGTIKTFSRGGSDISGAIAARALMAELYENFTDVSGMMTADPRIVSSPKIIDTISYTELRELTYMGATVLHDEAVIPVRRAGIPINIKNTMKPEEPGTMIVSNAPASDRPITGVAGRCGFSAINIEKDLMNSELGFGRRVLNILEDNGISFEHCPTGIDTMSVFVATKDIKDCKDKIVLDIKKKASPDIITIEDGIALIAVVGRGMANRTNIAARLFTAIGYNNIPIKMIDQGSCGTNIIIGVSEDDYQKILEVIYNEFIG